jgi:hypothetical protein
LNKQAHVMSDLLVKTPAYTENNNYFEFKKI